MSTDLPTQANPGSTDDWIAVIDVLDGLRSARQIAFRNLTHMPALRPTFEAADALYREFCGKLGVAYQEPFDPAKHAAARRAQGHPDFS